MKTYVEECPHCHRTSPVQRKTRRANPCMACSEVINRRIQRLLDADEICIGDGPRLAAELGLTHDTFLTRVSRLRRRQRQEAA